MLDERNVGIVLPSLIKATRDVSMKVRLLIFRCLAHLCENVAGIKSLVRFQGVGELLRFLQIKAQESYVGIDDDKTCTYALRACTSYCTLHDGLIACLHSTESNEVENRICSVKCPYYNYKG